MKQISKSNLYYDDKGNGYTQTEINMRINKAKEIVKENYLNQYGFLFCTDCKKSNCLPIEMSHTISIKKAKETRQVQKCWEIDNIKPRGHKCHAKRDGLF